MGVNYIETSAKDNEFVTETFELLGRQIYEVSSLKIGKSQHGNVKVNSKILEDNKKERTGCHCWWAFWFAFIHYYTSINSAKALFLFLTRKILHLHEFFALADTHSFG